MPVTTILVLAMVAGAFSTLALVLAWAQRQTRDTSVGQPAAAQSRRRPF
jgi:hypothetical protein